MDMLETDLFSSAVEIVDLTFDDFGETSEEIKLALGPAPWDTLELRLNRELKESFGEHARVSLEVTKFDAQVTLTMIPPDGEPEVMILGVPQRLREILTNAKENL